MHDARWPMADALVSRIFQVDDNKNYTDQQRTDL